jgi:hypothetical protein
MRALEAERDRLKAAAAQPAASEAEIAARFDGIKARQIAIATLARNGESDESVREEYASQYEAFEELLALMRRGARGDGALLRELTEARSVIELAASQLRVAWEKRDDAPLSAQSHLQEAAFALFHHAPKDGVLSTETVKLRQSVWKEIREAHQPEPKSDAGLREAAQALKVAFDADNYSEDHLTAVFKALAAHPPAPAAPVVPAVEDDEALLRQWLKEHVPTSSTDRVIAELCRRALKEKP